MTITGAKSKQEFKELGAAPCTAKGKELGHKHLGCSQLASFSLTLPRTSSKGMMLPTVETFFFKTGKWAESHYSLFILLYNMTSCFIFLLP